MYDFSTSCEYRDCLTCSIRQYKTEFRLLPHPPLDALDGNVLLTLTNLNPLLVLSIARQQQWRQQSHSTSQKAVHVQYCPFCISESRLRRRWLLPPTSLRAYPCKRHVRSSSSRHLELPVQVSSLNQGSNACEVARRDPNDF